MKEAEPTTESLPERTVRSEAWIEAFEAQVTRELMGHARRFAEKHARILARAGVRIEAMDLVNGVLIDTLAGVLSWDPARAPLIAHVVQSVRGRARDLREKAERHRHQSIDSADTLQALDDAAVDAAQRDTQERDASELARGMLAELRAVAHADPDVLLLIDAFERDPARPQDVMSFANLSKKRYRNARLRLDRMADRLGIARDRVQA